jgi:hypothetical protein
MAITAMVEASNKPPKGSPTGTPATCPITPEKAEEIYFRDKTLDTMAKIPGLTIIAPGTDGVIKTLDIGSK